MFVVATFGCSACFFAALGWAKPLFPYFNFIVILCCCAGFCAKPCFCHLSNHLWNSYSKPAIFQTVSKGVSEYTLKVWKFSICHQSSLEQQVMLDAVKLVKFEKGRLNSCPEAGKVSSGTEKATVSVLYYFASLISLYSKPLLGRCCKKSGGESFDFFPSISTSILGTYFSLTQADNHVARGFAMCQDSTTFVPLKRLTTHSNCSRVTSSILKAI